MTLHQPTQTTLGGVGRVLVMAAIAIAVIVVLTAIVGVGVAGPSLDITPDPAGMALPF
jgi:hypothetical protein